MSVRFHRMMAGALLAIAAGPMLVVPGMAAPPVAAAAEKSDAALVTAVKAEVDKSLGKDASDVTVTAKQGKVTLHGWVEYPMQEDQARRVATKVPGVKKVYSNIRTWSSANPGESK